MRYALGSIITLLLLLPFHSLKFVETVLHVAHHGHDHHHEHNSGSKAESPMNKQTDSHEGTSKEPDHTHSRDVWGLFAHPGLTQTVSFPFHRESIYQPPPLIHVKALIYDPFSGSLLRPPIA